MQNPILIILQSIATRIKLDTLDKLIQDVEQNNIDIFKVLTILNHIKINHKNVIHFNVFNVSMNKLEKIEKLQIRKYSNIDEIPLKLLLQSVPEVDAKTEYERDDIELNFTNLIRECLSRSYYEKGMNQIPLYRVCYREGFELDPVRQEIWDSKFLFVTQDDETVKFKINSRTLAYHKLINRFPVVKFLLFDNYVIAGGAALYAVRELEDLSFETDDLDLFIIAEDEKEANENYIKLLEELNQINNKGFLGKYNLTVLRNTHCTTVFFVAENEGMKIQIIHRIHKNKSQVVNAFDLAPTQILFDGEDFFGTYNGYVSILTNFIPVDIFRLSESFSSRMDRYLNKHFIFLFPGLDRKSCFEEIKEETGLIINDNLSFYFYMNRHEYYCEQGKNLKDNLYMKKLSSATKRSDYDCELGLGTIDTMSTLNFNLILRKLPVFIHEIGLRNFLTNPKCLVLKDNLTKYKLSDLSLEYVKETYGEYARKVWNAKFDDDLVLFGELNDLRFKQIEKIADEERKKLEKIKWTAFSIYESSQFYPLKMSIREFYGSKYNGFLSIYDWPAKMQIISAYRKKDEEKDCLLIQLLPKDVIKYIFRLNDLINYSENLCL